MIRSAVSRLPGSRLPGSLLPGSWLPGAAAVAGLVGLVGFPATALATGIAPADVLAVGYLPAAFAVVGLAIGWRRPGHPAVVRMTAFGALHLVAFALAAGAIALDRGALNALSLIAYAGGFVAYFGLFAVFPDGTHHRPWVRTAARAVGIVAALVTTATLLTTPRLRTVLEISDPPDTVPNPLALLDRPAVAEVFPVVALAVVVALMPVIARYRASGAPQRAQMRWPLLGVPAAAVASDRGRCGARVRGDGRAARRRGHDRRRPGRRRPPRGVGGTGGDHPRRGPRRRDHRHRDDHRTRDRHGDRGVRGRSAAAPAGPAATPPPTATSSPPWPRRPPSPCAEPASRPISTPASTSSTGRPASWRSRAPGSCRPGRPSGVVWNVTCTTVSSRS